MRSPSVRYRTDRSSSPSREVHAQLFTRHADGLRLAAHGEGFLRHAEHMLTTLAAAVEETRSAVSSVTGQVRIAITDTVSEYLLLKVIAVIRRQLPLVAFEPAERNRIDLEEGLRSGEFDLAVVLVSNLSTAPDIRREKLLKSTRQLWTSLNHPLAREKSVALRSLVAQNVGITTLSDLVFRPWSHDGGRIRRTRVSNAVPSMDLGLAYCRGTVQPQSTTAFAEALRSLAKTLMRESARAELGAWRCPRGPTGNDLSGLRFLARHGPLYQPGTRGAVQSTRPLSQGWPRQPVPKMAYAARRQRRETFRSDAPNLPVASDG